MKRKGTIILAMLLVFVIEVCLIYTLKGKMDTLLQFTKIFSVFLLGLDLHPELLLPVSVHTS